MLLNNILNLFFPKLCGACSQIIANPTDELCIKCDLHLIQESHPNTSKIQQTLRGRVKVEKRAFFIDFTKKRRCAASTTFYKISKSEKARDLYG